MPKLLQLNVTANWGSTGKIAEGIGLAAIARGWESAIAFGRMQNSSASKLIKVGNQFDVYYHYALNRLFDADYVNMCVNICVLDYKTKFNEVLATN
jgi:hypothetical protein